MIAAVPRANVVIDAAKRLNVYWDRWLQTIVTALNLTAQQIGTVTLTGQHATIATTAIPTPTLTAGLYRLSYTMRVTTVGSVSSSLTPTFGWTSGGVACSQAGAALTGNLTTSQQNGTLVLKVDAGTTVSYALLYASNAADSMLFTVDIRLAALP